QLPDFDLAAPLCCSTMKSIQLKLESDEPSLFHNRPLPNCPYRVSTRAPEARQIRARHWSNRAKFLPTSRAPTPRSIHFVSCNDFLARSIIAAASRPHTGNPR